MRGRVIPVLIEVNSAKEEQKSGVFPEDAERLLLDISDYPGISVSGLMTMGPVVDNPEDLRKYFRDTKKLFDTLGERYGFGDTPTLSMGMSDSYRVAIEEGSTLVRVGRRLFTK
jgi:pyridoxal phosphate enzyme (YggS family)